MSSGVDPDFVPVVVHLHHFVESDLLRALDDAFGGAAEEHLGMEALLDDGGEKIG